jgi:hypothetical protein
MSSQYSWQGIVKQSHVQICMSKTHVCQKLHGYRSEDLSMFIIWQVMRYVILVGKTLVNIGHTLQENIYRNIQTI